MTYPAMLDQGALKAPVQYGPRIAAVVIYLLHYQLLPEERLADLFGIRLVVAAVLAGADACRLCLSR